MRAFSTFIGVDLGGGKGKNTAVARLEKSDDGVRVVDYGTGRDTPWYDERLIAYLRASPDALVAIDAPLTLPACVRCTLPTCPTPARCEVPIIKWFRDREGVVEQQKKPRYTCYTQRASEVLLHEQHQILPRETLGQGMGPLTARGTYLVRALADVHRLGDSLIEVYPKATLSKLFPANTARKYKRSADSPKARLDILNGLPDLTFAPGAWREHGLANDHKFDAVVCAYTAWLHARGACEQPPDDLIRDDGWIYFPRAAS